MTDLDNDNHPEICWRDHFGSEGAAREYLVRLPDGFMLSCGIDGDSERRAKQVARMLVDIDASDRDELKDMAVSALAAARARFEPEAATAYVDEDSA
jgi:hypothetical protein